MKIIKILSLITLILLVAGCDIIQEPELINSSNDISKVQVSMSGNYRAILPTLEYGFSKYELSAAPGLDNFYSGPNPVVEINEFGGTIALTYGNWILTVTAFVYVGGTDYPAVFGSVPLEVSDNFHYVVVPVNTPLPEGTGTFNYEIIYPFGADVLIKLDSWPGLVNVFLDDSFDSGVNKSEIRDSGMYFLTIEVEHVGKKVIKNQIVHIYQESPTNVFYIFDEEDFINPIFLSGIATILINGVPAEDFRIELFNADNDDFLGLATTDSNDGSWGIILAPFDNNTDVYFVVEFADSNWNWYTKDAGITRTLSTYDIPNIDFTIDISTITLNGYADITRVFIPNWADVEVYRVDNDESLGRTWVNNENYSWQMTLEAFDTPTDIYFIVWRNDGWNTFFDLYDYGTGHSYEVYNEDIFDISLSYYQIYLGGRIDFTLHGTDSFNINTWHIKIGAAPGIEDIKRVYLDYQNRDWATWIYDNYPTDTVYVSIYLETDIGSGLFDLGSFQLDSNIITGIDFVGDYEFE